MTEELPPARLPLVDNISETFDKLPPINLFRAAANAKTLYPAFIQYMYLLFKPLELDGRIERLGENNGPLRTTLDENETTLFENIPTTSGLDHINENG